jgi:hypothetical protein
MGGDGMTYADLKQKGYQRDWLDDPQFKELAYNSASDEDSELDEYESEINNSISSLPAKRPCRRKISTARNHGWL